MKEEIIYGDTIYDEFGRVSNFIKYKINYKDMIVGGKVVAFVFIEVLCELTHSLESSL